MTKVNEQIAGSGFDLQNASYEDLLTQLALDLPTALTGVVQSSIGGSSGSISQPTQNSVLVWDSSQQLYVPSNAGMPWTNVTFGSGVSNFGSGQATCQYYRDAMGNGWCKGTAAFASQVWSGGTLCILPVGASVPVNTLRFPGTDGSAILTVSSDGIIRLYTGSAVTLQSIDVIRIPANATS